MPYCKVFYSIKRGFDRQYEVGFNYFFYENLSLAIAYQNPAKQIAV
jgi:hypothetical protein